MRIAVNTRFLLKDKMEGLGLYTYELMYRMVHAHPEHEYFFLFDRAYDPSFIFHPSIQPVVIYPSARHPVLWYLWFEHRIPSVLKNIKADVFFSPDGFCSLSTNVKQHLVVHDLAFKHFPEQVPFLVRQYYRCFVKKQIQKANKVYAVSEATKADLITQYGCSPEHIAVAYNGVRKEFIPGSETEKKGTRWKYSDGCDYFLFVGALHPRKNVEGLIKAYNLFRQQSSASHKLLLVGRMAWSTKTIKEAYDSSPFKQDILLLNYLDSYELSKVTAAAFAVIQPSFLEGFGVPVLEALNCDVPVLVSNCFSLPEVAGPGAYLFNPNSIEDIADKLKESTVDGSRSSRIEMGRDHKDRFSWEKSAEIVYQNLIA